MMDASCWMDQMLVWSEMEVKRVVECGEGESKGIGVVEDGGIGRKRASIMA
jgi:hypothetical protein